MTELTNSIDKHVRQMSPHIKERETAKLLIDASRELKKLENIFELCIFKKILAEPKHSYNTAREELITQSKGHHKKRMEILKNKDV